MGQTYPDICGEVGWRDLANVWRKKILNYKERKFISLFFYRVVFLPEWTLLLTDFYRLPSGNSQDYNQVGKEINNPKK